LTVARELEKLTDFKVFHNHLTADFAREFFEWNTDECFELHDTLRWDTLNVLMRSKLPGVIMTYCYSCGDDDQFIRKIVRIAKKNCGEICFVRLVCDIEELKCRAVDASRKKHRKLKSVSGLKRELKNWDFSAIPFVDSLEINNTNLSAKKVAKKIKSHFKL
jgi:hypothetical protein